MYPPIKQLVAASAIIAGAANPTFADVFENFEFSGILETQTALAFNGNTLQKSDLVLTPELSFDVGTKSRFTLIGRLRGDYRDRLEPGEPLGANRSALTDRLFLGDHVELEIREAYLDTEIGNSFLRLGKQQIVWGQADGLKVLDILNPQSFREFVLPEFEDSRIPLWSANAEIPIGDLTLQLVWIPDTTYDDIPEAGSAFAFTSPLVVPPNPVSVPVTFNAVDKPNDIISDSDVGVKLSAFLGGWDLSLNYAYHYVDQPVVRRTIAGGSIAVSQTYERSHLIGGTFSNVFGAFTLRGEFGLSTNRFFRTSDPSDLDGVIQSNDFSYVLGIDLAGFEDWFLSVQIFQSFASNHQSGMIRGGTNTSATFLVRRDFMNEALTAEALLIQDIAGGGLLQLAIEYEWKSNIRLKAGADVFYGKEDGLFGQFRENDRITFGVEVSF